MRKPSPSMIVALVALFVALSGVGMAANGGNFILGHSNSAKLHTVLSAPVAGGTALQVNNSNTSNAASTALGLNVAAGHSPFTVNSGVKVANLNADTLDGIDSSAFQQRVSGSCGANSAIAHIDAAGGVGCTNVTFYSGHLLIATGSATATFLTIPGIAHVQVLQCQAGGASAELHNDLSGSYVWHAGDTSYAGGAWIAVDTPNALTAGDTFHLGMGSGSGAISATITISTHVLGSQCNFQGTAEVITS
jgi:hypothetical protein